MISFAEIECTPDWQDFGLPAQAHYSDTMPYHNWEHARNVAGNFVELAHHCAGRDILLDPLKGAIAGAWHDAGFHEDHTALGFETKEHYSAQLASDHLRTAGVDEVYIDEVRVQILGTIHGAKRESLDVLALHRADIAGIGKEYRGFARNNYALLCEARQAKPDLSFEEWMGKQNGFIDFIIEEALIELPRLGEDVGEHYSFDTIARRNITKLLLQENEEKFVDALSIAV